MALNMRPLADRIIVEPQDAEETTPSGLLLPESAKEKPQQGLIVAAGPGRRDDAGKVISMDVKLNDKVLYAKYAGTEIKIGGKKYLILKESDILAVVE